MHPTAQISILKNSKAQSNKRLLGFAVVIAVMNLLFYFGLWQYHVWSPFAFVSLTLFALVLFQYKKEQQLLNARKNVQIKKLLAAAEFTSANHYFKKKVFQKDFVRSSLYDNLSFKYTGNNLLRVNNWFISNITVSKKLDKNKEAAIVFDGVFAKFKTHTKTESYLIIKPVNKQAKEAVPEVLKKLIHRYFTPKVKNTCTGNKLFDERFEVYAGSQHIQSKMLSEKVLANILDLNETIQYYFVKTYHGLDISFVENYIYVGIKGVKLFDANNNNEFNTASNQKYIELIKQIFKIAIQ